jgi:transposase
VIDLLPDRRAETFAAWLQEHPGVEVISRDRASSYAEGGRVGAPSAIQIADRWHLIQNLAVALDPLIRRKLRALDLPKKPAGSTKQDQELVPFQTRLTAAQQERREQLHERYRSVQQLYEQGQSMSEIARLVGIDGNTLRYFIQSQPWAGQAAHFGRKPGEANLQPYLPYLHKRVASQMPKWSAIMAGAASSGVHWISF